MRRALALGSLLLALPLTTAACGGDDDDPAPSAAGTSQPVAQRARAAAPVAAGTLAQIADAPAARRRLAYVNLERLGDVAEVVDDDAVLRAVLGTGAARVRDRPRDGLRTAVQVGPATVIGGDGDRAVVGAGADLEALLADTRPETNAIQPTAQSAAQSCLGDATAQTIVGPARLGRDAALGVGLRASRDAPAGVQLAVCYAPHYRRQVHAAEHRIEKWYKQLAPASAPDAAIGEVEIGEREMLSAVLPAGVVGARQALRLLGGGPALLRLAGAAR